MSLEQEPTIVDETSLLTQGCHNNVVQCCPIIMPKQRCFDNREQGLMTIVVDRVQQSIVASS